MSSQKSIEELRQSSSSEMYRESLEAMFEAWLLSENLPESVFARDVIYCNYKMLMKFLETAFDWQQREYIYKKASINGGFLLL